MTKVKKDILPPKRIVPGTRFRRHDLLTGRETRAGDLRRDLSGARYKVGATRFERATTTSRRPTLRTPPVVYLPPFPGKLTTFGVCLRRVSRASGASNGTQTGRPATALVPPRRSPTAPSRPDSFPGRLPLLLRLPPGPLVTMGRTVPAPKNRAGHLAMPSPAVNRRSTRST